MDQVHGSGALGKLEELLERIEVLEAMSDAKSMELTKCQHEIKEAKEEIYQCKTFNCLFLKVCLHLMC